MLGNRKIFGKPIRRCEVIEPVIHHIHDTMTAEADQMVMRRKIGIKTCPVVTHIYFLDEPGLL